MKRIAFSLVELMVALIIVSCIVAALAPVVTKKLKMTGVTINSGSVSEITTDCASNPNFGSDCKLCTKSYCINCGLGDCAADKYKDSKRCECKSCSEKYSDLCAACDSKGCTRCKTAAYYINNGVCTACPSGSYCDGVNIYATCPGDGYYCDSTGIHKCKDKFSSACKTCTSSKCTSCDNYFFLEEGICKSCKFPCYECTSFSYCTKCQGNYILDTSTHKCTKTCASVMDGCVNCSGADECILCNGKYFLNTSKKCTLCTISNCQKCLSDRPASSPYCELCTAGYYLNSSGTCSTCSSKFGSQCVSCNANQCLSCQRGYHLKNVTTTNACEADDNKFNCSDSNFMQIGNLCFTRRNMGDSNILSIPSNINKVVAGGDEICYSDSEKCCWKGQTVKLSECDSENGGYSGCNRTVCNWDAAKYICDNFNYAGKTWRLPTIEEMENIPYLYSIKLGSNGLMLCDSYSGYSSTYCDLGNKLCPGAYAGTGNCLPYYLWSGSLLSTNRVYVYALISGQWNTVDDSLSWAFSVRCVTEMDTGE